LIKIKLNSKGWDWKRINKIKIQNKIYSNQNIEDQIQYNQQIFFYFLEFLESVFYLK
jgi:hypothetical protein